MGLDLRKSLAERLRFQTECLPKTLFEARDHVPFYAKTWSGVDISAIKKIEDLWRLPIVSRRSLENAVGFFRNDQRVASVIHSTGSTGRPFVRYRSREELDAVSAIAKRVAMIQPQQFQRPHVVYSTITEALHGSAVRIPTLVYPIAIRVTSRWLLDLAVDLICRDPIIPGAKGATKEIHGRPRHLLILAHSILRRASDKVRKSVVRVSAVGMPIQSSARIFFRTVFPKAEIDETYSLSEVISGAHRCKSCGLFHMETPVVSEVVDLGTAKPLKYGTGMLIVTELFPFSQYQPLIRYETGDIVRALPNACGPRFAFEILGRAPQLPIADLGEGPEVLLTFRSLAEVLEDTSDIARSPVGGQLCPPYNTLPLGLPYAHASAHTRNSNKTNKIRLKIFVGITFDPDVYPEREKQLRSQIISRLKSLDSHFRKALKRGVTVDVICRTCDQYPNEMGLGK